MTELGTMLLSRVRIAFRVGLPALQRRLPDPSDVHPDRRDVSQGGNLAVLFYEVLLNQTAHGPQLTTADAVGRYFVLGRRCGVRRSCHSLGAGEMDGGRVIDTAGPGPSTRSDRKAT